jgi:hypothetical protein
MNRNMEVAHLATVLAALAAAPALAGEAPLARAEGGVPAAAPAPAGALFRFVQGGKWGYIDGSGKVVVAPRFDRAEPFSGGRAAVQIGTKHAYVDATGEPVLVPEQLPGGTLHRPFRDGRAAVRVGTLYGYIDLAGKLAIPARFTTAEDFSEGLALVCDSSGCAYVDTGGHAVLGPDLMGGTPLREGVAPVFRAMGMGRKRVWLLRRDGRRIPGEFEDAGSMSEGLIAVRLDLTWGYADARGEPAIPLRFHRAGDFRQGLAAAWTDRLKCGYVDRTGAFAIPPRFRDCGPFAEGLARVDLAETEGAAERVAFIDRTGKAVVLGTEADPPFDSAEDFEDGLAAVGSGGMPWLAGNGVVALGYVDPTGRYVWKPTR